MKSPENCTIEELRPYASEFSRRQRTGKAGKPKVLRSCPKCGAMFGARQLRLHLPLCKP